MQELDHAMLATVVGGKAPVKKQQQPKKDDDKGPNMDKLKSGACKAGAATYGALVGTAVTANPLGGIIGGGLGTLAGEVFCD